MAVASHNQLDRDIAYRITGIGKPKSDLWRWRGTADGMVMFVDDRGHRRSLRAERLYQVSPGVLRYEPPAI